MRLCAFATLALVAGCGSSGGTAAGPARAIVDDEALAARAALAPELARQAEEARARAERASAEGDADAAADHATEARLLLLAAAAEGERRRLAAEGPALAEERAAAEDRYARRHALAVALAAERAAVADEEAGVYESTAWRRRADALAAARRAAVAPLEARVRVLLAALPHLGGAEAGEVEGLRAELAAIEGLRDPDAAVAGLDGLRRTIETRFAAHAATRAAVLAAVSEAGLAVDVVDGLVVVDLGAIGPQDRLADHVARGAGALLARLDRLALVVVEGGDRAASLERASAATRAQLVELGVPEERLHALVVASGAGAPTRVSLRLLGYPEP